MKIFNNKILLIVGGTGSFGNAVLNHFINYKLKEIRIFSRDEKKQEDMRRKYNNPKIKFYIGDVRDYQSLNTPMKNVDYVFHAAALKQVPSCEFFPMEAVKTNIIGANNVLECAIENNVRKVIVLSTDKAVNPINTMGMTKAVMERIMVSKSRDSINTVFCGTRYGNVLASRGSVIPLFIEQIISKNPITITNPEMTRFAMTLEESVKLVVYAMTHGKQGDIFVQKAPAFTIKDLAIALKELYNSDAKIVYIGSRHAEKLYETLINKEEMIRVKDKKDFYIIPSDARDLNYGFYINNGSKKLTISNEYNSHNTKKLSIQEIKDILIKTGCLND